MAAPLKKDQSESAPGRGAGPLLPPWALALAAEFLYPTLIVVALILAYNVYNWPMTVFGKTFGSVRFDAVSMTDRALDRERALQEFIADRDVGALIGVGGNGPVILSDGREQKFRLDEGLFPRGMAISTPAEMRKGRVRIGDVRCCGRFDDIPVYAAAGYDGRFEMPLVRVGARGVKNVQQPQQQQEPAFRQQEQAFALTQQTWRGPLRAAILDAGRQGVSSVVVFLGHRARGQYLGFFPGYGVFEPATFFVNAKMIAEVAGGGSPVRRIHLVAEVVPAASPTPFTGKILRDNVSRYLADMWPRLLGQVFTTRLPFPGGSGFTKSQPLDKNVKEILGDPAMLFNPAIAAEGRATALPALAGISVWLLALAGYWWRQGLGNLRLSWPGIGGGSIAAVMLGVALFVIDGIWIRTPDSPLATLPGLITIMVAVGAVAGIVHIFMRTGIRTIAHDLAERFRSALYRDVPLIDKEDDRLDFRPIVDSLFTFLKDPDTRPPLVIGINGPWGSGKSSVMGMLDKELRDTKRFRSVWINAWRYEKEEQMMAALLQVMAKEFSRNLGFLFRGRLLWARYERAPWHQRFIPCIPVILAICFVAFPEMRDWLWKVVEKLPDALSALASANKDSELSDEFMSALGLGGVGSAVAVSYVTWFVRLMKPFRLPFKRLYKIKNYEDRVGFIGEFAREFELYRKAIPKIDKFVVYIDDLDRCPPDKVVDMLKTINLIINSGTGADKTIFIIGFDQRYVRDCVELYFKEFVKRSDARASTGDEPFGPRYLKKMVTLSVSVPLPTTARILEMLESYEERTEQKQDIAPWQLLLHLAKRAAAGFLWLAARIWPLAVLPPVVWWYYKKTVPTPGDGEGDDDLSRGEVSAPLAEEGARIELPVPELTPPVPDDPALWLWGVLAVTVLGCAAALYFVRPIVREWTERHKGPFIAHIRECVDLLPRNPRDAVRLINSIRVGHAIQASGDAHPSSSRLSEREFALFSVLRFRHPALVEPAFVEENLLPSLKRVAAGVSLPINVRSGTIGGPNGIDPGIFRDTVRSLNRLKRSNRRWRDPIGHFFDADKIERFVEVNRYILELGGRSEDAAAAPSARPSP